ncbi:CLUMA_CG004063, isoform A [Clunio marinus]|uniref:CLUMA_CG004063, isoform A n=1 Tax=Clunio marinus TaxID=568069 RepID=A0A1J1HS54_9DIPT|nr:CLUMA_CG004063, isoform A [Clunio marinus]
MSRVMNLIVGHRINGKSLKGKTFYKAIFLENQKKAKCKRTEGRQPEHKESLRDTTKSESEEDVSV